MPALNCSGRALRLKLHSQRSQAVSSDGRITSAPRGSIAERRPLARMPGAASGVARLGVTQPALPFDAPPPTTPESTTTTSQPASVSEYAHASPITPPPTTITVFAISAPSSRRRP